MVSRISAASSGSARPAARLRLVPCPGLARSSSREVSRADCPDALLAGGAAGLAEPGSGDRPGQDLQDGVLAVGEAGRGPGQRPQRRLRVMAGRQRQDVRAGQPQRPAGDGGAGRQRRPGRGGDGVRAGPGRLDGALDQAGRDGAGHPQADASSRRRSPPAQAYSQPRCGCPCHHRAQAGRSSPVRCPHSAAAPAGPACGGARTVTCRAASANAACCRRRSQARPAITAVTATASSGPATGP